jgi:hypothetical protein
MRLRLLLVLITAVGVLLPALPGRAQPQAQPGVVQLRPAVSVLLEDLHNQSRTGGTEGSANFGQDKLKGVLEGSGAEVSDTLMLLANVPPAERKLTPALLSRFDVVISNGRYASPSPRIVEFFAKEEIEALDDYMRRGGIFFAICAGATLGKGCVPPLYNPLLKDFGVQVAFDENPGSRDVPAVKSFKHPLLEDIPALRLLFATSLQVTNREAKALFKLDNRPVMVVIPRGKGALIVAGGGSGWMNQGIELSPPSCAEPQKKFLKNLVAWAAQKDAMGLPK